MPKDISNAKGTKQKNLTLHNSTLITFETTNEVFISPIKVDL